MAESLDDKFKFQRIGDFSVSQNYRHFTGNPLAVPKKYWVSSKNPSSLENVVHF